MYVARLRDVMAKHRLNFKDAFPLVAEGERERELQWFAVEVGTRTILRAEPS